MVACKPTWSVWAEARSLPEEGLRPWRGGSRPWCATPERDSLPGLERRPTRPMSSCPWPGQGDEPRCVGMPVARARRPPKHCAREPGFVVLKASSDLPKMSNMRLQAMLWCAGTVSRPCHRSHDPPTTPPWLSHQCCHGSMWAWIRDRSLLRLNRLPTGYRPLTRFRPSMPHQGTLGLCCCIARVPHLPAPDTPSPPALGTLGTRAKKQLRSIIISSTYTYEYGPMIALVLRLVIYIYARRIQISILDTDIHVRVWAYDCSRASSCNS